MRRDNFVCTLAVLRSRVYFVGAGATLGRNEFQQKGPVRVARRARTLWGLSLSRAMKLISVELSARTITLDS